MDRATRRNAVVSFLTLFGVMGGYALLETARDTLFLARLPAARLPWAYLLTAAAVSIVAALAPPATRASSRRATSAFLVGSALAMLALWTVGPGAGRGLYVLYVAVGVVGTLMLVRIWTLIGAQFNIGEARRLYAWIAGGGVLGAIAASTVAARLVERIGARGLIGVAAMVLAVAGVGPLLLRAPAWPPALLAGDDEPALPLRRMVRAAYARRIFWMVALTTIATTIGDFVFKSAVATTVPASQLGTFFAFYQVGANTIGLVMQVLVAPLLLRRLPANRMVLLLPGLLVGAAAGLVVAPGLAASLVLKGIDAALRNAVHRTSTEVLYVPLPLAVRGRLKTLVDGVGQRSAQALASLVFLGGLALGATMVHFALAIALASAGCLLVALGLRRQYVQAFRDQLRAGTLDDAAAPGELDLQSVESLLAMLNSASDDQVIAALETLAAHKKARLIPGLLVYHPSQEVATRALEILATTGRADFVPLTERLLSHPDAALRAAASRVRALLFRDERQLRRLADDARPEVQAGGLVALVHAGRAGAADLRRLGRLARRGPRTARLALLAAMARLPHERFVPLALTLAGSGDGELQQAALRTLRATDDARALPVALQLLAVREAREEARKLFVEQGAVGLVFLATALHDPAVGLDIRRHIPRTISRYGGREGERAAAILLEGLLRADDDSVLRYKMLRGLGRMKHDDRRLRIDRGALVRLGHEAVARSRTLRRWRLSLDGEVAMPTGELLHGLLVRKELMARERAFRVLDLLRPGGDLERIYDGLDHGDAARRASSRELLEYVADPALRREVLALVDEPGRPLPGGATAALAAMARDRSAGVRALAAEHAAARGGRELRRAS